MNINLEDLYVVSYSYICEDGEIITGDNVIIGRENALKVAADRWEDYKKYEYAHVIAKSATISASMIIEDVYSEPIFNQETECEDISWDDEDVYSDDFWDDDDEYVLAD